MANSSRFKELRARLRQLRRNLLPHRFSPTGSYTERQIDSARGYRLLVHAEIEAFIEDVTRDTAIRSIAKWKKTRKATDVLLCFLAHYHSGWDLDSEQLQPAFPVSSRPAVKDSVAEIVDIAIRQYITIHENNHGVLEKNLKRLILPVGIRKDDLDQTWITNLESFGKARGEVAHKTSKVQQQIDPKSELQAVTELLIGLQKLDQLIINLGK